LHEELSAAEMLLGEGKTTAPTFLTETELITLMDKHGIGTDATIHEHIKTVLERGYCVKQNFNFIPTFLGVSLVDTYS
jgi:DNA topoisomerase-3